jgi:hypothetical protein
MMSSPATARKTASPESVDQSEQSVKTQQITADYLNPNCDHGWSKLAKERQTMESEGKTIWQCDSCKEIVITYDWQKPTADV